MKLVINVPCYNEEKTLPLVLRELPKEIEGISSIRVQVVDDGCSDKTAEVARKFGAEIVTHKRNLGLGMAFQTGARAALEWGADIFINTDADNQYPSRYIPFLVKPVLEERADIVIGNRIPWKVKHFPLAKKIFQYFGNLIVRKIACIEVPDTVSGFRAYSRESLLRLNVTSQFSYVLDTLVQASKKGFKIVSVPIKTNPPTRKSRLFRSMFQHMRKSAANILRVYTIYEPFKTFLMLSAVFFIPAVLLLIRFFSFYFNNQGSGHIQSLVVSAILFVLTGFMFSLGVVADLIGINRKLVEDQLYLKKKEFYKK